MAPKTELGKAAQKLIEAGEKLFQAGKELKDAVDALNQSESEVPPDDKPPGSG